MIVPFARRLLPLLLLLFAITLRVYELDTVRHNFDAGYPHGLGIGILEAVQAGRWQALPALSLKSTVGIPNGAVASYWWAAVALFDRSAFFAVFVSVLLNVLVVAQTYDLTHKLTHSRNAAAIASALAAASLWGAWQARSATIQGQLEFWTVTSAWLLFTAIERRSHRRLLVGFAFVAIALWSYVVALIVLVQAGLVGLIAIRRDKRFLRPVITGALICGLSLGLYLLAVVRDSDVLLATWRSGFQDRLAKAAPEAPAPSREINLVGWEHALRIASGRDFQIFTDTAGEDFPVRRSLNDIRATLVDLLITAGGLTVLLSRQARVWPGMALLAWFGFPVLGSIAVEYLSTGVDVTPFYLMPTSPAVYVLAAFPIAYIDHHATPRWLSKQGRAIMTSLACLGFCLVSGVSWPSHNTNNVASPLAHSFFEVPLRWQTLIGNTWRAHCGEIGNSETPAYWLASILQDSTRLRWSTAKWNDLSAVWEVPEGGGSCFTQMVPAGASRAVLHLKDVLPVETFELKTEGGEAHTYRAGATSDLETNQASNEALNTNIGWSLVRLDTPQTVRAGEAQTVVHVWRIVSVPEEAHYFWHYAAFVKLLDPHGKVVVEIASATSVDGFSWRAGDYVISVIMLDIPSTVVAGKYVLQLSLFDPNQERTAVYLRGDDWSTASLFLERNVLVTSP